MPAAESQQEAASAPAVHSDAEFSRLANAAMGLQIAQAKAAMDAMKLPEKRLDDAGPNGGAPGYILRDDGDGKFTKVDSEGREIKDKGKDE